MWFYCGFITGLIVCEIIRNRRERLAWKQVSDFMEKQQKHKKIE